MKNIIFLDGKYINADAKLLAMFTPGHQTMHGVFETMRLAEGTIECLDEHLKRMMQGLKVLKIHHAYTTIGLKNIANKVVKNNSSIKLGRVRILIFKEGRDTHCAIMVLPYHPPTAKEYKNGLRVQMIKTKRPANARLAQVKSLDYAVFAKAYANARAAGYDDGLLINAKGHIFESTRANIFIVKGGKFITPPLSSGCLNGIIRQQIIAIARTLDIPVKEQNITPAMLKSADYAFLTNSMLGMIGITKII